ncbi:DUF3275 family protein, partial [Pseudomonas aeruginosa]|uniref:DUF3275 family protein n=1 Tax=Pseudomonas aeruginosa TaxID=287 RepID=UPI0031B6C911
MINIPGQLAIRTINGRNGEFNVGKLSTSIGEFVIKDALLDQHIEGKYRGDFAITEIRPSYYTTGGRLAPSRSSDCSGIAGWPRRSVA